MVVKQRIRLPVDTIYHVVVTLRYHGTAAVLHTTRLSSTNHEIQFLSVTRQYVVHKCIYYPTLLCTLSIT